MKIILLGCPGAGKDTQAKYLSEHYNIPLISTSDILRTAIKTNSEFANKIKQVMLKGGLVSDGIIISLIKNRIWQEDCRYGYVLNGFPRTVVQAKALTDANIDIDYIINIYVSDKEIINRISGRRIHQNSGRVYHIIYNPPKKDNMDDITGESLIQRDDDLPEIIIKRLQIYHKKTEKLIKYYNNLRFTPRYINIDGMGTIIQVRDRIFASLV